MNYYYWANEEKTMVKAVALDGDSYFPANPSNRFYRELLESGVEPFPFEEIPGPPASTEEIKRAYQHESDPLFFQWQAGEKTKEEWLAKREEIRFRFTDV